MSYRVGIDLGGTKILITLAEEGGKILSSRKFPTRAADGLNNVIRYLITGIREVLFGEGVSLHELDGIGICVAGFFDIRSRTIISSPNLPGWEGFPLEQELKKRLNVPVLVDNDASAAAYGEYLYGAGKGKRNMVNITLGTGIGGGIITEGRIYRGSGGFAGEIGHIIVLPQGPLCGCGRCGCLESLSSGSAIAREGRMLLSAGGGAVLRKIVKQNEELTAGHVFEAAKDGDEEAAGIIEKAAYFLGLALAFVVNILNPEVITMGGGMARTGEMFFAPVRRYLKEAAIPPSGEMVSLVPAALGEDAGVRGMLSLLEQYLV
ncbi:MAG: ROK family protein [Dethiobacter sp.]|jgi:glucokinase|nr:MAG: ROK family protein [Dethiobacter sp.]